MASGSLSPFPMPAGLQTTHRWPVRLANLEVRMDKIASELLVERLADWGVDTVFGLPGDGINGIMEGLRRHQDTVRFVLVHHEEAAAFMAAGYAKATGKVGVCLATSGPGGLHLMNGLYDAKLDHAPVLAITGMQETAVLGTGHQQEVHLDRVFMDLAEYNVQISTPGSIPSLVDRAMRTCLARRPSAHHRRAGASRHQAQRGRHPRVRHPADGRYQLSLHRPPARARPGPHRPDRQRPHPGRQPH